MGNISFLKRNQLLSVKQDDEHRGSASYVQYDEKIALIQYLFVENVESHLDVFEALVKYVETCILEDGYQLIYLLADEEDFNLYFRLGYQKSTQTIDQETLKRLLGVELQKYTLLTKKMS